MKFLAFVVLLAGTPAFSMAGPAGYAQPRGQEPPRTPGKHLRPVLEKRQQFSQGQPINALGNGGPILGLYPFTPCHDYGVRDQLTGQTDTLHAGGTNKPLDLQR